VAELIRARQTVEMSTADEATRRGLVRRGFALEYATLTWNVVGIVVLAVAAISAQANGITLLLLAVWFAYESVHRLIHPPQVSRLLVLFTALVGVVVPRRGASAGPTAPV